MKSKTSLLAAALGAVAIVASFFMASTPDAADADTRGVRFWVTEYRMRLDMEVPIREDGTRPIEFQIRGRASLHGSDKVDFSWTVGDARPYLDVINACSSGRLHGTVVEMQKFGTSERGIDGSGELRSLNCRNILK